MIFGESIQKKLANRLFEKLKILEIILGTAGLLGYLSKIFHLGFGSMILIISLSALGMVYFLMSYRSADVGSLGFSNFINKLIYIASSISILGILFRLQNFPGYNNMLTVGCLTLIISLLAGFIKNLELDTRLVFRTIIIIIIGLFLKFLPMESIFFQR